MESVISVIVLSRSSRLTSFFCSVCRGFSAGDMFLTEANTLPDE